jgi:hypothetical protein
MRFVGIFVCLFCGLGLFPGLVFGANADAVLLRQRTFISMKGDKLITDVSNEIQINNAKGERFTTVSVPYGKLNKISKLQAFITDMNGNVLCKLKPAEIKKKSLISDAAFFQDMMEMEFSLTSNQYPYILHYSYTEQQSQFLYINRWLPVIDSEIDTKSAELTLQTSSDYHFTYHSNLLDEPVVTTQDGNKNYVWKTGFTGISDGEIYAPPLISLMPELKIVPLDFRFETVGSFESWKSYGQWQYDVNNRLQDIPETEQQIIKNMLKDVSDTLEIVRRLYHYLQDHTRYVNISIETGGMIPVAANLIAQFKYGDCKGLSNYMQAMLRVAGIRSHYTDVHAGDKIRPVNKSFPSQQFNHVILTVPLPGDTLWLDCTSKGPFNYQGTFIQNRPALLMENGYSRIVHIPALSSKDVMSVRNIILSRDSAGLNQLQFSCVYRGENFELLSELNRRVSESKKQQLIRDYFGLKNIDTEIFSVGIADRDSIFATLEFNAVTSNCIENVGKETHLKPIPFKIPLFRKPAYRKLPVQIDYPLCLSDTQTFVLPEQNFAGFNLPDINIETPYGNYYKKFDVTQSGQLRITKFFEMKSAHYQIDKYSDFYDFIRRVNEAENSMIILKK